VLTGVCRGKLRMLKNPCVFVEEKDRMQTGGQRGVDVALGTVVDYLV
jgi:hypothetical protein